jgi:hypothetical protein
MKFTTHFELHSQTTRLVERASRGRVGPWSDTGFSPSATSCSKELETRALDIARSFFCKLQLGPQYWLGPDFKFELLPLHSPLLRQSLLVSFPPLIDMLKFSGYPYPIRGYPSMFFFGRCRPPAPGSENGYYALVQTAHRQLILRPASGAGPNTKAVGSRVVNDARTGMPPGVPRGAMCVQRFDDSLNSAIRITYRISLRSSSTPEPRDPLLKVFFVFDLLRLLHERLFFSSTAGRPTTHAPRAGAALPRQRRHLGSVRKRAGASGLHLQRSIMIPPQVHLRRPCYDFYFL